MIRNMNIISCLNVISYGYLSDKFHHQSLILEFISKILFTYFPHTFIWLWAKASSLGHKDVIFFWQKCFFQKDTLPGKEGGTRCLYGKIKEITMLLSDSLTHSYIYYLCITSYIPKLVFRNPVSGMFRPSMHSFNKYLLSLYCSLGSGPDAKAITVNCAPRR